MNNTRFLIALLVAVMLGGFALNAFRSSPGDSLTYSELLERVETAPSTIEEIVFRPRNQELVVTFTTGQEAEVNYPSPEAQFALQRQLDSAGVRFDSEGRTRL